MIDDECELVIMRIEDREGQGTGVVTLGWSGMD